MKVVLKTKFEHYLVTGLILVLVKNMVDAWGRGTIILKIMRDHLH